MKLEYVIAGIILTALGLTVFVVSGWVYLAIIWRRVNRVGGNQ